MFDREVDWPVAGAGAAGMTGAVVAHQLGGSVLVVEKESVYGGTTLSCELEFFWIEHYFTVVIFDKNLFIGKTYSY